VTTLITLPPNTSSDSLTNCKYVSGGYSTSCSSGYTDKKLTSAPHCMNVLGHILSTSGHGPLENRCATLWSLDALLWRQRDLG
jgi:hypothetical protein